MNHPLANIPGITFREPSKGFVEVVAQCGYYLTAMKRNNGKWTFSDMSGEPTRPCHFTLRHKVHQALNPDRWKALAAIME